MAYIAPNSIVELFRYVNLTENYNDTLWFANSATKDAFFDGLNDNRIGRFTPLTYNREERGFVRLEVPYSTAINANYMRFKNTSFENKWFYAFVTNVEYINNQVTQITFSLDYMLTWMGSFTLGACFIERTHPYNDDDTYWLTPEPFNYSNYVYTGGYHDVNETFGPNVCCLIAAYTTKGTVEEEYGGVYHNGIYSGLHLMAFKRTDTAGIRDFIHSYNQSPDSIVSLYTCPISALPDDFTIADGGSVIPGSLSANKYVINIANNNGQNPTLDGYTPRNMKLYAYPFSFVCVDNGQGDVLILKTQYSDTLYGGFDVEVCENYVQPVYKTLRPRNYKGSGVNNTVNTECLTLTGYPICSWVSDSYAAWLSQNCYDYGISALRGVFNAATSPMPLGIGLGGALVSTATQLASDSFHASIEPDIVKGDITPGNANFSAGKLKFSWGRMCLPHQLLQQIDKYFDLYGYAINEWGFPRMYNRPYWTYLKTKGCHVEGNLPSDHAKRIEDIIDNGCRFWTDLANIGDYLLNNHNGGG